MATHVFRSGLYFLMVLAAEAAFFTDPLRAQAAAQNENTFDSGWKSARNLMKAGKHKEALAALKKITGEHYDAPYVKLHAATLIEDFKNAAFLAKYPPPTARSLLNGEVSNYDPATGRIKVKYASGREWDFVPQNDGKVFPARFIGPFTVELRGSSLNLSQYAPAIAVCSEGERYFMVVLNTKAKISRYVGKDQTILDEAGITLKENKPFAFKVVVNERVISVTANGSAIMSGSKKPDEWGHLAFFNLRADEVHIDGRIEPSWLQQKIDEEIATKRVVFEKSWVPEDVIPVWILEAHETRMKKTADAGPSTETAYPELESGSGASAIETILSLVALGDVSQALAQIDGPMGTRIKPGNRLWVRALAEVAQGNIEQAQSILDKLSEDHPKYAPSRILRARMMFSRKSPEAALKLLAAAISQNPDNAELVVEMAMSNLLAGRIDAARQILKDAMLRGMVDAEVDSMSQMVEFAVRGPNFARVHEYKSSRYHIISDIDRTACAQAGEILEQALLVYKTHLKDVDDKGPPFRVYLFGGENAYKAYCETVLSEIPSHTAGLYTSLLKQLLIWNLPRREDMMRTVRHEGFHQYLDHVAEDPPVWFNEGMAEYFEKMDDKDHQNRLGAVDPDQLEVALATVSKPDFRLDRFMRISRPKFYAAAESSCATGWGIVHWLRHGNADEKARFKKFFDLLCAGERGQAAVRAVFPAQEEEALRKRLIEHLSGLTGKR